MKISMSFPQNGNLFICHILSSIINDICQQNRIGGLFLTLIKKVMQIVALGEQGVRR